ncbi:MAG: DegT/DnrJ/EryC1/StrS family aminotransferase [Bdellovibrionales bacterium]|nr:DegT/DnrJ/EryC1/StrS family aminotransferase [Bdellovibrionales bacterium]
MQIPFIDLKTQYENMKEEMDQAIHEVLDSSQFILGPAVTQCETSLEEYVGVKHAWAVASGTDALMMALMALEVGPGDEVIVPGFSFFATAEAVSLVGATPVFVDIDPVTYNINTDLLESAFTEKTKAIIPVGLYGQPSDMDAINTLAQKHGVAVVEDAAQSFGSSYKGKKSGGLGTIGCTSFFPAKPLGCYGDGGAVFTDDDQLAEVLRQIRMHGEVERYSHGRLGINGRMDSIQCAVINVKLPKFNQEVEQRQVVAKRYLQGLADVSELVLPVVSDDCVSAWAQFTVRVSNRPQVQERLKEKGVPTAVHYPSPMYKQPVYKDLVQGLELPECEKASQQVMSLPMHPFLQEETQDYIISALKEAVR